MNETYQEYINRVVPLTLKTTVEGQLNHIQKSAKFEGGQPVAFPGYTIMTPPYAEDQDNQAFYNSLQECQAELVKALDSELLISLPPESFHLTVADLVWDSTYLAGVKENPDFDNILKQEANNCFDKYKESEKFDKAIELQLLGLTVFPRALAICLVTKTESDYLHIMNIRQAVYQNRLMIALGVQQQHSFVGHVTLGYFGEVNPESHSDRLLEIITKINEQWIDKETPTLKIQRIQLRKFDNMVNYYREANWPEIVI
ncbi:MAG: DUF1868 domain-containing protein [Gloeocapsa sp. DLM2.Bin57]|nr:MAG: DUF1868 domain-containing protein [Gloeocapsa sp. DLM2.Bin57]